MEKPQKSIQQKVADVGSTLMEVRGAPDWNPEVDGSANERLLIATAELVLELNRQIAQLAPSHPELATTDPASYLKQTGQAPPPPVAGQ